MMIFNFTAEYFSLNFIEYKVKLFEYIVSKQNNHNFLHIFIVRQHFVFLSLIYHSKQKNHSIVIKYDNWMAINLNTILLLFHVIYLLIFIKWMILLSRSFCSFSMQQFRWNALLKVKTISFWIESCIHYASLLIIMNHANCMISSE